jgi:hypothetical protein
MAAIEGRDTSFFKRRWASGSDLGLHYLEYIAEPDYDPITRYAWLFRDAASYGSITYGKTSMVLNTLAGIIGQDTMADAMRTYFMRFRFTHPTGEDFLRTIEEVAIQRGRTSGLVQPQQGAQFGQPSTPGFVINSGLRPFFNQAVYGTAILDYAIDSIDSSPLEWWLPDASHKVYLDVVTLHRLGDFVLPVTLEVVFSDGSHRRETWDGADRWKSFRYESGARIVSAEIDPDHTNLLDVQRFNNSRTVQSHPLAASKLTTAYLSFLQISSQLLGWLV